MERLPTNVPGQLFVDSSCIDCDVCRWMAPETFDRREGRSRVHHQPAGGVDLHRALQALVSCPTASIGTTDKVPIQPVLRSFPIPVDGSVHHCGYHHPDSFGASSYLIRRRRGNVLVDSPRFAGPLVRRLEELGGVRWMFLTHADDVGDHRRFHEHFGCERILHARDVSAATRDVEHPLDGDKPTQLDEDLLAVPVPGHTEGSTCLLHADTHLFSGDHLAYSPRLGHLYAFRSACWYDWDTLVRSMQRLTRHAFTWVLPGHGRRAHFPPEEMRRQMQLCLDWALTA